VILLYGDEFKNTWDIDVFKTIAKESIKDGGWISYKNVYEKEKPCNGQLGDGMSIDNLVGLEYVTRVGCSCSLTEKGLKRYNEIMGA
jgi:hypothetical protein